jgi:hypothetical protein
MPALFKTVLTRPLSPLFGSRNSVKRMNRFTRRFMSFFALTPGTLFQNFGDVDVAIAVNNKATTE